jgi:3-deoxy-manno-octulosonate cytidylyltransferase (CMP-KDO synthetase)
MNTALIIPARLGSTRLSRKMLCQIGDQPLIAHTIDRAKESGIQNIILASDSEEILEIGRNKNVQSVLTSTSNQSGSDRIYEALTKIDHKEEQFEFVINLQGDLPFISPEMIRDLKNKVENSDADIVTLVAPITDPTKISNINFVKVAINFYDSSCSSGKAVYFSRQPIPHNATTYYEHIGIYAYKRQALKKFMETPQIALEKQESLEQLRAYAIGLNIEVHLVNSEPPISIDTTADLALVRELHLAIN